MQQKNTEIENMIKYLSKNDISAVNSKKIHLDIPNWKKYYLESVCHNGLIVKSSKLEDIDDCDSIFFYLDLVSNMTKLYAYNVSYHNGDHYNRQHATLHYDSIYETFEWLLQETKIVMQKKLFQEQQEKLAELRDNRLKAILDGTYK